MQARQKRRFHFRFAAFAASFLWLCAASNASEPRRLHLFLLSGQSNMLRLNPEVSFVPALEKAFPEDELAVVKVAYGGRSIDRWVPKASIYAELVEKAKDATRDKTVSTITFVWMQGERDHQEDASTKSYQDKLNALYRQLTEDFGRDDINWVIGRLNDARIGTPNWDAIRAIQMNTASAHKRAAWIDTDDLNGPGNQVHCTDEGYATMGARFAQKAIELIRKNDTETALNAEAPSSRPPSAEPVE